MGSRIDVLVCMYVYGRFWNLKRVLLIYFVNGIYFVVKLGGGGEMFPIEIFLGKRNEFSEEN